MSKEAKGNELLEAMERLTEKSASPDEETPVEKAPEGGLEPMEKAEEPIPAEVIEPVQRPVGEVPAHEAPMEEPPVQPAPMEGRPIPEEVVEPAQGQDEGASVIPAEVIEPVQRPVGEVPAHEAPMGEPPVQPAPMDGRPIPAEAVDPVRPGELKPRQQRKQAKMDAREELHEMARQTRADKKQFRIDQHRRKAELRDRYPTGKLRRRARRLRWKQAKLDRRQALKERYQDAPWIIRVPRLYLLKPFIALLILAVLGLGAYAAGQNLLAEYAQGVKDDPVSKEEIYKLSPIDEKGAKRIDAVAPVGEKDTWTISVYIVGSNLEDMGENDLSDIVWNQIQEPRAERQADNTNRYSARMNSFSEELEEKDLELPDYLYYPQKPVPAEEEKPEPVVAEDPGFASTDIEEMTAETWSDNISIVVQTGGATRWSNDLVNPNRTQRFLYHKGNLEEVENLPLQEASDPKTLTSFLDFCKEEYPADHNMLILWNHGGGSFGFGHDSIFGGMMSLADIREALGDSYKANIDDPAFDIIGFDACLMSSLEVTHALDGFASYYAVSAETEPADGWDYAPWLKAMTKDPTMSPARVCREIADSYMDHYMTQNVNMGWIYSSDVNFSVVDARKAGKLYDAWCDLSKKQLIDATRDNGVLAEIGRCSKKSTYYASTAYSDYNTLDLGNYLDLMADTYPAEASRVKKLLGEAMMYHRENGALSDSQGMSVYTPGAVKDYRGLSMCLQYIYDVCDDPATRALYYYKIAGCLNEDMEEYLGTITDRKIRTLDTALFRQFTKTEPVPSDTGFDIPVEDKLQEMVQSYELEAAVYDEDEGVIRNYGKDELVRLDGEGNMDSEFDGTWICFDGVPLATEVVSSTDSMVEYRSRVLYNDNDAYLTFSWDRDAEEFTINGVRAAGLTGSIVYEDPVNYLSNSRMNIQLKAGDRIIPVYETSYLTKDAEGTDESKGDTIKVSKRSKIRSEKLPSGYYLTSAVISDYRGDVYYSQVVGNEVSGGGVRNRVVDSDFIGRDY